MNPTPRQPGPGPTIAVAMLLVLGTSARADEPAAVAPPPAPQTTAPAPAPAASSEPQFLQVGRYRINVRRIAYTHEQGDTLKVVFGGASREVLELRGEEARTLRTWVERHAHAPASDPRCMSAVRASLFVPDRDLVKPIRISDPMRTPQVPVPIPVRR